MKQEKTIAVNVPQNSRISKAAKSKVKSDIEKENVIKGLDTNIGKEVSKLKSNFVKLLSH